MAVALTISFVICHLLQVLLSIICAGITGGFICQLNTHGLSAGSLSKDYLMFSMDSGVAALFLLISRYAPCIQLRSSSGSLLGGSLMLTFFWVAIVALCATEGGLDYNMSGTYTQSQTYIHVNFVDSTADALAKAAIRTGVLLSILYMITSILGCVDMIWMRQSSTNSVPQAMQLQKYANKPSAYSQPAYLPQGYPQKRMLEIPQGPGCV